MKRPTRNNSLACKVRFSVNLEEDLVDKLDAIARATNTSRSFVINDLLCAITQVSKAELYAVHDTALDAMKKGRLTK